ncbi:hypothetical protein TNCV_4551971 [Trichonephila clavipes]|nr:hypothetical protein TNCV_4551971 [Trichonephila clavipes]
MFQILLWSPWKYRCGQRTVRMAVVACSQKQRSLRAQAQLMRTETVETFELVKVKQKLLDIRAERRENARAARGLFDVGPRNFEPCQVTWMTPELAPLFPNSHTTPTGKRFNSQQI